MQMIRLLIFPLLWWGCMNSTQYPQADFVHMDVTVQGAGMSPEEMERLAAIPVEAALRKVPSVEKIQTNCLVGECEIRVWFGAETDQYDAREKVLKALQEIQSDLPPEIRPPVISNTSRRAGQLLARFYFPPYLSIDREELLYRWVQTVGEIPGVELDQEGKIRRMVTLIPKRMNTGILREKWDLENTLSVQSEWSLDELANLDLREGNSENPLMLNEQYSIQLGMEPSEGVFKIYLKEGEDAGLVTEAVKTEWEKFQQEYNFIGMEPPIWMDPKKVTLLEFSGENPDEILAVAEAFSKKENELISLGGAPGNQVHILNAERLSYPEIKIEVDREKAALFDFTVGKITSETQPFIRGFRKTIKLDGEEAVLVLNPMKAPDFIENLTQMQFVHGGNKHHNRGFVPLAALATIQRVESWNIFKVNARNTISVLCYHPNSRLPYSPTNPHAKSTQNVTVTRVDYPLLPIE